MIPKTELRYSFIYNAQFDSNFKRKDILILKKRCQKFEEIYKKHIKILLETMEKKNKKWERKFISIYIVKNHRSFSDPLTLRYNEDPKYMFVTLAHELLHNNNVKNKKMGKIKTRTEIHQEMEPVLNNIIRSLPINLEKQLNSLNNKLHKVYGF